MSSREISLDAHPRLAAHARVQWDAVRERQVLLMPEGVLALNATAYAIIVLCDGQHAVSEIIAMLSEQYNRPVEQDVLMFLERLLDKRALDIANE